MRESILTVTVVVCAVLACGCSADSVDRQVVCGFIQLEGEKPSPFKIIIEEEGFAFALDKPGTIKAVPCSKDVNLESLKPSIVDHWTKALGR